MHEENAGFWVLPQACGFGGAEPAPGGAGGALVQAGAVGTGTGLAGFWAAGTSAERVSWDTRTLIRPFPRSWIVPGAPCPARVPHNPRGRRGDSVPPPHVLTASPPCSGMERGRDAKGSNSGVSGLPRRRSGQRLTRGCCRPSARPPVWGKKPGIWELCAERPRQNPHPGLSPGWQNSSSAWNPPDHPGQPPWVALGQAGSVGTPVRGWGGGAGTDPVPGIGGLWLSPNRASQSVATPWGAVLALGRFHQGLRLPGTPRAAWRGEGTVPRDAAPVHGGKFPVVPPSSPCPSNGCHGPSLGLPTFSVACPSLSPPVPSLATFPSSPGTPRATRPHQDAADPPLGSLPAATSVPALPDPSFLRNGGRGTGRVCLSAPSHRRQARALPRPEPCLGPLPVPWHPLGAASSTPAPRPPKPSPPGRAGLGAGGSRCGLTHAGGGMGPPGTAE